MSRSSASPSSSPATPATGATSPTCWSATCRGPPIACSRRWARWCGCRTTRGWPSRPRSEDPDETLRPHRPLVPGPGGALPAAQRPLAVERPRPRPRPSGGPRLPRRLLHRDVDRAHPAGAPRLAEPSRPRGRYHEGGNAMTLAVIIGYLLVVLVIGLFSHRFFRGTSEDFFVAARTLGPFILLISLFGANMTAFALLGSSGEAYMEGIGVFALMASSSGLVIPVVFYFIGTRIWALGKRRGYLTPVQFFRERWGSDNLGLLLFVVQVGLLIPYLLIGVMGGGSTLTQVTGGQVPDWVGGLVISAVVLTYVTYGGMRGTVWVNVFQTVILLALGFIAFWVIIDKLGGLSAAMA
ncbi:MAG TPA: hypothetical protein DD490_31330, partial [Acidobacteria bacterium]|nr:hypothetical protein [Acidobacteriota bacterium]